jgi:hypothetical protein
MAAFFSYLEYRPTGEWKEEIVAFDLRKATIDDSPERPRTGVFPDGTSVPLVLDQDPRELFASWLLAPRNPWFARSMVNRIWAWLVGRGIIHEADDIRPDNPPSNPELLAYLEEELAAGRYDLKRIYRLILHSTTYQLSWIAASKDPRAAAQFAHYPLRPLEAEVLIDALCQITGTTEQYSSAIPEPFTFIPEKQRSIALADASISSPFLDKFGRSPRDTGLDSERPLRPTAAQRLHLLNSSHIRQKIEQSPRLEPLLKSRGKLQETAGELYVMILSRKPTEEELQIVQDYARGSGRGRGPWTDLAWALINSAEFLHRH